MFFDSHLVCPSLLVVCAGRGVRALCVMLLFVMCVCVSCELKGQGWCSSLQFIWKGRGDGGEFNSERKRAREQLRRGSSTKEKPRTCAELVDFTECLAGGCSSLIMQRLYTFDFGSSSRRNVHDASNAHEGDFGTVNAEECLDDVPA